MMAAARWIKERCVKRDVTMYLRDILTRAFESRLILQFRLALPMLGLGGLDRSLADQLFDSFDRDGSGTVEYKELQRQLKPKAVAGLQKARSAPRLDEATLVGEDEYKQAVAAQDQAKKRLARIQKELLRAASTSALHEKREQKRRDGEATRRRLDQLVGRDYARALASTPAADEVEVRKLSVLFRKAMDMLFPGPAEQRLWYKLFTRIDEDKSGRISFQEMGAHGMQPTALPFVQP